MARSTVYLMICLMALPATARNAVRPREAPAAPIFSKLIAPASPLTGVSHPLSVTPANCPAGYLPQYCALPLSQPVCPPGTPPWICSQNSRAMTYSQYQRAGCTAGQTGCLIQPRSLAEQQSPPLSRPNASMPSSAPANASPSTSAQTPQTPAAQMTNPGNWTNGNSPPVPAGSIGVVGDGQLRACPRQLPAQVKQALDEALKFRAYCGVANRGEKPIVVNDYSWTSEPPPKMWVFTSDGTCKGQTPVTYGNGAAPARPLPCSQGSSHLTPPGFHLTALHEGGSYGPETSLTLLGVQGQGTLNRDVLIHHSDGPGAKVSWGCSGVGCFNAIKQILGFGALVYNYFGNANPPSDCGNSRGLRDTKTCEIDKPSEAKYQKELDSLPPVSPNAPRIRDLSSVPVTKDTQEAAPTTQ